jgi:hypothetical protein
MPLARPAAATRKEDADMRKMALCVGALVLAGWLAAAPAAAQCYNCTNIEIFAAPPVAAAPPPVVYAPAYPYYPTYPPPPRVRGYTLR